MKAMKAKVRPSSVTWTGAFEALIRRTERLLGVNQSRKVNLWLTAEEHYELSRRAHAHAAEHGHAPSVHKLIKHALGLHTKRPEKKPIRRLRSV